MNRSAPPLNCRRIRWGRISIQVISSNYCTWHEDANQAPVRKNLLPPQTSDISFSSHLLSSNFLLISSHLIILFDLISTQLFSGHLRWFQLFSGPKHVPKPDRRPKPPKKQVIETFLEGNFERFKRYLESQKRESSSKTHRRNFGVASPTAKWQQRLAKDNRTTCAAATQSKIDAANLLRSGSNELQKTM